MNVINLAFRKAQEILTQLQLEEEIIFFLS